MNKNMMLDCLFNLYQERTDKNKYLFEDTEIIEYDENIIEGWIINTKLIKAHGVYMIFVLIDKNEHLGFKGLLEESEDDLSDQYSLLKEELKDLSLEEFLNKYFEKLKNNFS